MAGRKLEIPELYDTKRGITIRYDAGSSTYRRCQRTSAALFFRGNRLLGVLGISSQCSSAQVCASKLTELRSGVGNVRCMCSVCERNQKCTNIHALNMNDTKNHRYILTELFVRFALGVLIVILEHGEPFQRKIHADELWLYKNPRTESYVPTRILWVFICIVPIFIIFISSLLNKGKSDGFQAFLALTLAFGINGFVTNSVKLIVGRPRPDYFYRCFPDGKGDIQFPCTGLKEDIIEGLKSFPSGHSSFAFDSMMFCTLYLSGKLQIFNQKGRGKSWRLLLALSPIFMALLVGLSRTCDYHHHWQDVLVGSLLGTLIACLCYFQYYPPLSHPNCSLPYSILMTLSKSECNSPNQLKKSDSLECVSVKWI